MKRPLALLTLSLAASLAACATTPHDARDGVQPDLSPGAKIDVRPAPTVRYAVAKVSPAVVRLDVVTETFSRGQPSSSRSTGSGVIIDKEGHILTNFHVAGRAKRIEITLANLEHVRATLVGSDHWTDLALVKLDMEEVKRRGLSFQSAPLGDSDEISLGQPVMALGTPYGLTRTLTAGIISNTDRYFDESTIEGYETGWFNNWIQTDAAINPGNSGGPLINLRGEVIGINTRAATSGNNLGFAIPINIARQLIPELMKNKTVSRSYAGLILQPLQDLERFYDIKTGGVLVASVEKDSPAALAGIKAEDILLAVNGQPVNARFPEQLAAVRKRIADQPIGSQLKLTVIRRNGSTTTSASSATATTVAPATTATTASTTAADKTTTFTLKTDKLESAITEERSVAAWGLSVRSVTRAYLRENRLPPNVKGVLVTGVSAGQPAERAQIERGNIILSVDDTKVTSADEFAEAVRKSHAAGSVRVVVRQDRGEIERFVKPGE